MGVSQIILCRQWLFDKDVTIRSWSNMCQFLHKNKKIKLLPLRPKFRQPEQTPTSLKKLKKLTYSVQNQKLAKGAPSFPWICCRLHLPNHQLLSLSFSPTSFACSGPTPFLPYHLHYAILAYQTLHLYSHLTHVRYMRKSKTIMKNNVDYKAYANSQCRLRIFNINDYVMVCLRSEYFFSRTVKKLHA